MPDVGDLQKDRSEELEASVRYYFDLGVLSEHEESINMTSGSMVSNSPLSSDSLGQ